MGDRGVVGVADDMGEGMQCVDHPYRSNPGGVCGFCLQEKLGKLVSSSKSSPFSPLQPPPSSSSSPTSFRSDGGVSGGGLGLGLGLGLTSRPSRTGAASGGRRTRFPFLAASHSNKKKKSSGWSGGYGNGARNVMASVSTAAGITDSGSAANDSGIVLKRSKSTAPRTAGTLAQGRGGGGIGDPAVAESPRKKSFWSFLYLSSASSASSSSSAVHSSNINRRKSTSSSSGEGCDKDVNMKLHLQRQVNASDKLVAKEEAATAAPEQGENGVKEAESPNARQAAASSFGRKVARSRSVGCGSRSFSGDFLERISTGFGDCTLRRVESQREAKPNIGLHLNYDNDGEQRQPRMKVRFKCGGLFGGFGTMYAYWLSAAAAEDDLDDSSSSRTSAATPAPSATAAARGRTRSWSLAFASPMRAFRPYSSSKPLYAIHNAASAAPATNIISSINGSNGGKGHKLHSNPSFLAVES